MKHCRSISRAPKLAQSSTDLSFLVSILTLTLDLFSVFLGSFSTAAAGVLDALGTYNDIKNPST